MEYSYKFRLYPNQKQEDLILRTFGCCRFVFNYYLAQRMEAYRKTGKAPTRFMQDKDLTTLKQQEETSWLREVDKCALQNALKQLDAAYQNFFRNVQEGKKPGFPHFKSKKQRRQSYQTNSNIKVLEGAVQLPKLGRIKCRVSRAVQGRILSATVSRSASGKYYVSLCCRLEQELPKLPLTGGVIGLDLGLKSYAVTSDAIEYENPEYLRQSEKKLKRLQRQLSRKTKGSAGWEKTRLQLARCYEHVANQRRDMQQKLSTQIVRQNDIICVENLASKSLMGNHELAKAVGDAAWFEFRRQLTYKAKWYGKRLVVVDRCDPSAQCGGEWEAAANPKDGRRSCPRPDAQPNAAASILQEGLRLLA